MQNGIEHIQYRCQGSFPQHTRPSLEDFNTAFGSMGEAMLTLLNHATLVEWPEMARPIYMKHRVLMIPFAAFM